VVLEGTAASPQVIKHERRPLQLTDNRPEFMRNARSLFVSIMQTCQPDKIAYVLSMAADSQSQVAGQILPFGALSLYALDNEKECKEFIAANFSKKFFLRHNIKFTDKYAACDSILGAHPPNWTKSEQLAALAALGAM
jgi:hypothetical protein